MKKLSARLAAVFLGLAIGASAFGGELRDVSVIELIATPERFHGQEVRVIGYLHLEFEGDAVYLHREDFEYSIAKNSLAIDVSEPQMRAWQKLNNRYVMIEGRFSSAEKGHFGMRAGALQQITRLSDRSVRRSRKQRLK